MNGWLAVAAVVSAYDIHAGITHRPTMSAAFRSASRKHPMLMTAGVTYLVAHLYGALPQRIDPLRTLGGNQ